MFNRSEILRSAWAAYRLARPAVFAAGDETGKRAFLRPFFAKMLRLAWDDAKKLVSTARLFVEAQRRSHVAVAAQLSPEARSARISTICDELVVLDYAPLGVRTSHRRHDLGAELSLLQHCAT